MYLRLWYAYLLLNLRNSFIFFKGGGGEKIIYMSEIVATIELKVQVVFRFNPATRKVDEILAVGTPTTQEVEEAYKREYRILDEIK